MDKLRRELYKSNDQPKQKITQKNWLDSENLELWDPTYPFPVRYLYWMLPHLRIIRHISEKNWIQDV